MISFVFGMLFFSQSVFAGDLTVISQDTLSFKGPLIASDVENFKRVLNSDIKKIIVDSGGGDAEAGLSIAELIEGKSIEIEVQGICMSSCANYLFVAGGRRILNQGIVGYHGNMKALMDSTSKEVFLGQMKESGLSDVQASDLYAYFLQVVVPRETAFFARRGVSQALFSRTQREDKGLGKGVYSALLPKPATFEKYGIHNVIGEQSQFVIDNDPRVTKYEKLGAPVVID